MCHVLCDILHRQAEFIHSLRLDLLRSLVDHGGGRGVGHDGHARLLHVGRVRHLLVELLLELVSQTGELRVKLILVYVVRSAIRSTQSLCVYI